MVSPKAMRFTFHPASSSKRESRQERCFAFTLSSHNAERKGLNLMKFLSGLEPYAFAALRVVAGFLFLCHGAQKLFGAFGGPALHSPLFLTAGIIEFGGGILIALGLFTRVAAFIATGEMAVAYFKQHAAHSFFPIINKGELAVVYCFLFLFIACHGAGKFGIDKS
jgi:putative oxidoreductase